MKKYSPPRSTLNVSMPWTRRLTGSLGMVNVAPSSLQPDDRVRLVADADEVSRCTLTSLRRASSVAAPPAA
jgi:hypothetical protein